MLVNPRQRQVGFRNIRYVPTMLTKGLAGAALAYGASKYYGSKAVTSSSAAAAYRRKNRKPSAFKLDNNANRKRVGTYKKKKLTKSKSVRNQVKDVKRSLRTVNQKLNAGMGRLTFRNRTTGRVLASVNQQTLLNNANIHFNFVESVLAQLRYYNPSTPSTLVTADGTTGTYSKSFLFKSIVVKTKIRNNYQVPCIVRTYNCIPKTDTSTDPATAFTQGLADVGNPTSSSQLVYISDSPQFSDLWKCLKSTKNLLMPGDEIDIYHKAPAFHYDPSYGDSNTDTYQPSMKSNALLIRVDGILGHDISADEQGFLQAGIDYTVDRIALVEYQAGADIEYVYVTDSSDSFTNGGVVSSKPVADNQAYSVA